MLSFLRRKKSLLMWIVSPVIVVSFVFFYGWSGVGTRRGAPNELLEIGGNTVRLHEFYMEERNVENYFRMIYEGQLPPGASEQFNFRRMALNNLLDRYYFLAGRDKYRIPVSQELVLRNIRNMFRGVNDFDTALQRYLSQTGMSEQGFFSLVEADIASRLFSDKVRNSGISSAADIQRYLRDNHQKRKISYVRFRSAEYIDELEIIDEEMQSFYEENREDYRTREQYDISYVQFSPAGVMDEVEITEEEIKNYYEINLSRYMEPERRELSRILLNIEDPEDEEAKQELRAQAEEIRRKIMEEEADFSDMAKEYSDGPEGERGGDFGVRTRQDLPVHFTSSIFALEEGGISPVLDDRMGLYLFQVQAILPERQQELEEVSNQIRQVLQNEKARGLVMEKANSLRNEVSTLTELKNYAQTHELEIKQSGLFSTRNIPGLGSNQVIFDQVGKLRTDELGDPVRVRNNAIVYGLENLVESYIPSLDDIRVQVREDFRQKQAIDKAQQAARHFRRGLRGNHLNFGHMAAEHEKEVRTTEEIRRQRDEIGGIGKSREFVRYVFDASLNQIGPVTEMLNEETGEVDTFIIWYCLEIIEPDEETFVNNWGRGYNFWASRYGNSLRYAMFVYLQEEVPMRMLHPGLETMLMQ